MAKSKREEKSVELENQILENYQPKTVEDMQNVLKDIFDPMFEAMLLGWAYPLQENSAYIHLKV
ncbi:hypothetical protein J6TS1_14240 [Siminovitchia terrae]|uniref:Uncharacterized protein n=1 Tax=Siminovitchia terrae TaxID=1914933 RepID=A0ABQ4KU74_SIMTE|nr:hypothetical protein J6TS1_14240 [Siminovitchia terrae]